MKKIFLLFIFILPISAFATSGACSYHGGVNCSAGASYYAVCKDGTVSNTLYYLTDECSSSPASSCVYPYSNYDCKTQADYNRMAVQFNLSGLQGGMASVSLNACKQQITQHQAEMSTYQSCISQESTQRAQEGQARIDSLKKEMNDAIDKVCSDVRPFTKKDPYADACICIDGYQMHAGKCVTRNEFFCYQAYGDNAELTNAGCGCKQGYYQNENDQCVYGIKPTIELTQNLKNYLDFGNKCSNIQSFSNAEIAACFKFEANPKYYKVVIVDSLDTTKNNKTSISNDFEKKSSLVPSPTSYSGLIFNRTLKKGMSGDDIKQLQILLQKLNYLPSTQVPSTYFGVTMSNALIKFQKDNKIQPATGSFGPVTQAKLLILIK
jgi:hypothetical protein